MTISPRVAAAALALLAYGAYSAYDAAAKVLGAGYHPFQIVGTVALMLMPLLLMMVLLEREAGPLRPALPGLMALRALATVVNVVSAAGAVILLPLSEAYAIFFTMPLMIALLAVPLLGERIDPVRGAAVLAGLAGVMIALDPVGSPPGWGHAVALTSAFSGALNHVVIRKTGNAERRSVLLVWPFLALLLATGATMPWVYRPMPLADLGVGAAMAVLLLAGFLALVSAYRRAPAIVVAPMQYSQIVWAAALGALLFGEPTGLRTLAGSLLIAAAGLVVALRSERGAPPA